MDARVEPGQEGSIGGPVGWAKRSVPTAPAYGGHGACAPLPTLQFYFFEAVFSGRNFSV
jgi:hypothetical protein